MCVCHVQIHIILPYHTILIILNRLLSVHTHTHTHTHTHADYIVPLVNHVADGGVAACCEEDGQGETGSDGPVTAGWGAGGEDWKRWWWRVQFGPSPDRGYIYVKRETLSRVAPESCAR